MGTRETRLERGRRHGATVARRALAELRTARTGAGMSQRELAALLGLSQGEVWKLERSVTADIGVVRLCEVASVLGFEVSVGLHPAGPALRDKGHRALAGRLKAVLGDGWQVAGEEVPFPMPGDPRHWDLLLRRLDQIVGGECETRIRDEQELVRRMRGRERDGGVDEILLVLSDSAHNRRLVESLRAALGERYLTSPRKLLAALRRGERLAGSGVVLL